ncbi:MAG: peptidylprolyl isomerase [Paludibacteraceae bacterium]
MATLEKMRHHGVFLLVVVGVALLAFIVGDFLNSSASIVNAERMVVAKIDGDKIGADDYMAAIDQMTEVYKIEFGITNISDELNDQIRQSVWETLVRERLLRAETEEAGMEVGKQELYDLILGNNIHPIIQSRRAFFNPQTNSFDPALLAQFINMLDSEDAAQLPADQLKIYKQYWTYWESTVKHDRLETKYNALLQRSFVANNLEVKNAYNGDKTQVDVAYVAKPYFAVADSLVSVSDRDIKKRYQQKKEQFAREASCDLKYVAFPIKPSETDYADVEEWINRLKDEFAGSDDVADVTNSNSDLPYKAQNWAKSDVPEDLREFAFAGKKNDVVGPLFIDDTYKMARIVETGINLPDSIKVRFVDVAEASMPETQLVADSLATVLRNNGDFAAIQQHYRGGEAWAREVDLDRDIAEKLFSTPVNGVFQQKNMGGIRLFQVLERGAVVPKVKLAVLERKVIPSSRTQAQIFNTAKQFAAGCATIEDFEAKATEQNIEVLTASRLNPNSNKVRDVKNSRQVVRWAFEAEDGAVSDVFECDNQQIVAAVSRLVEKGYAPIDDVKPMLEAEVRNDKKAELIKAEFAGKSYDELVASGLSADTVRGINFNMQYAGAIGNEPALFALAPLAEVGAVSQPQKGNMGVFEFVVLDKTELPADFDENEERVMLTERMRNSVPYLSIEALKKAADIQDERYKMF